MYIIKFEEENLLKDWLTGQYDYEKPRKGEIRTGVLLELDEHGAIIDIGLKHDGFVPRKDIENLDNETITNLELGQEVTTKIVKPRDQEEGLILSMAHVQAEEDWQKAENIAEQDKIWQGDVIGLNRGGLLVAYQQLTAFVPASHLWGWHKSRLSAEQRQARLERYVGTELSLIFIEIDRRENRLIASERLAKQQLRQQNLERMLAELSAGQVHRGRVSHITKFGAFVDLGEVDGLIYISELSHRRVEHPHEVVEVGDEIEVYVLNVDYERQRIHLSLKQLQPNPWESIEEKHKEGQLVEGTVQNVVNFGAFVTLDAGVDGLLHVTEIADPTPDDPREFVECGERLKLRIVDIDAARQRLGLSLKQVP